MIERSDILNAIKQGGGVITWWPNGKSHNVIAEMINDKTLIETDCSTSQETVYELRVRKKVELLS